MSDSRVQLSRIFQYRLRLVETADGNLRKWRALAFILAAIVSIAASIKSTGPVFDWMAGFAWLLFAVSVFVHRSLRMKEIRLRDRLKLESQFQSLATLTPAPTDPEKRIQWNFEPAGDENGKSIRRLVRDLDLIPSTHSTRAFAAMFPFFLSTEGRERFVKLLVEPVHSLGEILRRQGAVQFWEHRTVLRRKILRVGVAMEAAIDSDQLKKFVAMPSVKGNGGSAIVIVSFAQLAFFVLWIVGIFLETKLLGLIGMGLFFASYAYVSRRVDLLSAYPRAMLLGRSLRALLEVAQVIERVSRHPAAQLATFHGDRSPIASLREIERTAGALGTRQNPLVALLINFFIPWDLYWTVRFDRARAQVEHRLASWLESLAELEAFIALAEWNRAHGMSLPVFSERSDGVSLHAKALAHPLLSPAKRVANDLTVRDDGRCHLITGSNMSGKSTFLRSIGLNLLLAHAGAKVTAREMRLVPLRLESSMRPSDSLEDGFSSFYSEVADLVEIVKRAGTGAAPVFYLIDEIFRGTNNRERRIGAESVIRALATTPSMGMVTTHDLDLSQLEGKVQGVTNHHFRDDVTDGVMTFSYEYRKGPCPSTNAVKVMRSAGLQVFETSVTET